MTPTACTCCWRASACSSSTSSASGSCTGGPTPAGRSAACPAIPAPPDFLFPQQASPTTWRPGLIDYLFTAYTNIIAFSPTDTMPLTHRVKILFTVQSSAALLTIVITLSRAINLIPGGTPGA